ncbi:NACHT domain-containing protein [Xanthomonas cannabis]|uniref:NACHT domain-containing protein n=1 Tax=Xanthomonas cannabis TaxID=1885674 RepID=UPI00141BBB64|nr:hypothetical protein [Xanthomonas cannabis]NIK00190.1 hypothetical protein [Xanthomonas cannabis]NIK63684.1 hypothetical protein [Xanthomonas cannabis]
MEWMLAFLSKLGTSLLVNRITALPGMIKGVEIRPLKKYSRRLEQRISEMPFLYRGMSLSSKDDYIEPLVGTATDELLRVKGNPSLSYRMPFIRFQEGRKAIIFGEGGYGKTTLFRHVSLRSLEKDKADQFWNRESLVPVFVQLKTVKSSSEYPVLDAIKSSDPYFQGAKGEARLRRLAKKRRLMIFLDGYDEMPYVGTDLPHFRGELETLLGQYNPRNPSFFEANKYGFLYRDLQSCRVYLSTRREFFFHSPIETGASTQKWVLKGIGDRRIELVERVFSHHTEGWNGPELDSELFLQRLSMSGDAELVRLSTSPLFLTVMCFVYASDLKAQGHTDIFGKGAFSLINRCMALLLHDLDEGKTHELGASKKLAYMNRRAAFVKEKNEFLAYFSSRLYAEGVGAFKKSFILDCASKYFASLSESENRHAILTGLSMGDPSANIVDQIIFSGIFVVVDKVAGDHTYDFPHRSFREALAISWFDDGVRIKALFLNFSNVSYTELILAFVSNSSRCEYLVEQLVEFVGRQSGEDGFEASILLSQCLCRIPGRDASAHFSKLISTVNSSQVRLPYALLDFVPQDAGFLMYAMTRLKRALESEGAMSVGFWMEIVSKCAQVKPSEVADLVICNHAGCLDTLRIAFYSKVFGNEIEESPLLRLLLESSINASKTMEAVTDIRIRYEMGRPESSQFKVTQFLKRSLEESGVSSKLLDGKVDSKLVRQPVSPWRRSDR